MYVIVPTLKGWFDLNCFKIAFVVRDTVPASWNNKSMDICSYMCTLMENSMASPALVCWSPLLGPAPLLLFTALAWRYSRNIHLSLLFLFRSKQSQPCYIGEINVSKPIRSWKFLSQTNLRSSVLVTLTIPVIVTMSPGTQLSTKTNIRAAIVKACICV